MFTLKQLEIIKTATNSLLDDMDDFPNDYTPEYQREVTTLVEQIDIEIMLRTI